MNFKDIRGEIGSYASSQADSSGNLYKAKDLLGSAKYHLGKVEKFKTAASDISTSIDSLELLDLERQVDEKEEADYNQALSALEMMSGWDFSNDNWMGDVGLGKKILSGNNVPLEDKVSDTKKVNDLDFTNIKNKSITKYNKGWTKPAKKGWDPLHELIDSLVPKDSIFAPSPRYKKGEK